jgi:hypothetical protein
VSQMTCNASRFFGWYVDVLFAEKARQDVEKQKKGRGEANDYNSAYREVIKLFLNSLTGKLVENPARYFSLAYTTHEAKHSLTGINCLMKPTDRKFNPWLVCGVMVYSYSKRLLNEYMRCLPNGTDDVINVETDSIYFDKKYWDAFEKNVTELKSDYPAKLGKGTDAPLGCVKQEYDFDGISYFLGKKFYAIGDSFKIKGIPLKTIDEHGNDVVLVGDSLYEEIYQRGLAPDKYEDAPPVTRTFSTMKKNLWGDTSIASYKMTRTIQPMACGYKLYE